MSISISPRSRTITLILACLLFVIGLGGLHRFYSGKIISGIIQLITAGGFLIWQIIDIVRIIVGSYEDAQNREISEW